MNIQLICTNNNTRLILISDKLIKYQVTTGMVGFKGATRSSIYGADKLVKNFLDYLKKENTHNFDTLLVQGIGPTRNYVIRKLSLLKFNKIKEITRYPHNGCRLPKSVRK